MSETEPQTQPPTTAEPPTDPAPDKGGEAGRTFTQAELDRIIEERLARSKKATEAAAARAAEEARQRALLEQGEYQKLAEERAARLAELEPQAAAVERYRGALEAVLAEHRKGLPAHLVTLLDRLDPVEQLEYLAANAETLRPAAPPAPAGPNLNGGRPPAPAPADDEARRRELEQRYPALKRRVS